MSHEVIAIGGSAGAVEVLLNMVGGLPADLPASLFVVVHTPPDQPSLLPDLLSRRGPLPARHPLHAEPIEPGHIYVAPPDNHLLVRSGFMEVVRGPRENGQRPAADPLFRSAASSYGPGVVGVVLSGYFDCGTAGMMSIKARGGVSVVQAPDSAAVAEMPRSVIERVDVDHVVEPGELARLITTLATSPSGRESRPDRFVRELEGQELGRPVDLVCPLCQGVLTEAQSGRFEHFRCHVGHTFSLEALVREQGDEVERALWAAVRALQEGAALSGRVSARETGTLHRRFAEKARTQGHQAELLQQILLHGAVAMPPAGPKES